MIARARREVSPAHHDRAPGVTVDGVNAPEECLAVVVPLLAHEHERDLPAGRLQPLELVTRSFGVGPGHDLVVRAVATDDLSVHYGEIASSRLTTKMTPRDPADGDITTCILVNRWLRASRSADGQPVPARR